MIYDPLPRKLKAIRAIMAQPYYGIDGRDFAIDYVYSHDFWVVGTRQEIFNTRARCAEEVGQMEKEHPFLITRIYV